MVSKTGPMAGREIRKCEKMIVLHIFTHRDTGERQIFLAIEPSVVTLWNVYTIHLYNAMIFLSERSSASVRHNKGCESTDFW